ncbi:MAG: reverse transcriptase/maturase family protein [Sulfurovaceae bacterium]|nr:reverse transcriptase/maturase family protein [Sulfurovaceae bacterium]
MKNEVIAGGNWNNSSNAGVGNVNLNNNRTNSNNNVGVRDFISMPETSRDDTGNIGVCCPAKSEIKNTNNLLSNLVENQIKSKRIGNLFEKAFSVENLYQAFLDARKGKRKKRATLNFEKNLGTELLDLYSELHDGDYKTKPYKQFKVYEPKERVINAPHFRDLVVQHAIYRVIYPIFDKSFADTSYACRKGGGTHKASAYTQKEMRKHDGELYYVKLDIRKFFYNIDREILRKLFEKKIKDKKFIEIMMQFANMDTSKGIPIGNLLSQLYALIYMNPVDHYAKRELKVKSYVRYVDDIVAIGVTLDIAKNIKNKIEKFIQDKLNLEYSHWMISKIKKGINFVGYRTWKSVKFVRKHSMYKFKKAIKKSRIESIVSLIGHAKGTASTSYFRSLLAEHEILNQIPKRSLACLNM